MVLILISVLGFDEMASFPCGHVALNPFFQQICLLTNSNNKKNQLFSGVMPSKR